MIEFGIVETLNGYGKMKKIIKIFIYLLHNITLRKYTVPKLSFGDFEHGGGAVYFWPLREIKISEKILKKDILYIFSVILHEYVHHIQHIRGFKYEKYDDKNYFLHADSLREGDYNESFCLFLKTYQFEKEAIFVTSKIFGYMSPHHIPTICKKDIELIKEYEKFDVLRFLYKF